MKIFYFIFILVILLNFNFTNMCVAYQNYTLQAYNLCASGIKPLKTITETIRGPPTIKLENEANSAAIITQIWNSTDTKVKSNCKFRIVSLRPRSGIYITISKLNFRKNLATNHCVDYIEFSQPKSHRSITNRTCDNFGSYNKKESKLLLLKGENELQVTVSIDKKLKIDYALELNIVATSYYDCDNSGNLSISKNDFQCEPNDPMSCISENFVNDGIKNCLSPCNDEHDCALNPINESEVIDASHIALSAVTSLIFTMICVGLCLWVYWKYKDCTSLNQYDNDSNEHQPNENINAINISSQDNVSRRNQTVLIESQRTLPKEDLPPSYESLFPDR